jgi:hypothetical protein
MVTPIIINLKLFTALPTFRRKLLRSSSGLRNKPTRPKQLTAACCCFLEVEVKLRPTVSRSVRLGVRRPSGKRNQFYFLFEISFRQLQVCYFIAPSLTRRRVCNLLYNCFWALPEQSLLGRSPAELTAIFTVSFETPPTWRTRFPYLYPPGTGWPSYTSGHRVLLSFFPEDGADTWP